MTWRTELLHVNPTKSCQFRLFWSSSPHVITYSCFVLVVLVLVVVVVVWTVVEYIKFFNDKFSTLGTPLMTNGPPWAREHTIWKMTLKCTPEGNGHTCIAYMHANFKLLGRVVQSWVKFIYQSLKRKLSLIPFKYNWLIACSTKNWKSYARKCVWTREKETRIQILTLGWR